MTTTNPNRHDTSKTHARSLKDEARVTKELLAELDRLLAPEEPARTTKRHSKSARKAA